MILTFLPEATAHTLEFIATVTFVAYLVLQIMHSRYMWYLYIPSCICAAINFFNSSTWAFAALNVYYVVMGVVGIVSWNKDRARVSETGSTNDGIILNRLPSKTVLISAASVIVGIPVLYFLLNGSLLSWLGGVIGSEALKSFAVNSADPNPLLDAITTALSIIGTWWLTKSYLQQWWIWIVADVFAIVLNLNLGNNWFVLQFTLCIISSFIGLWNWKRKGTYVQ